jgi:hypothetical protein
MKKRYEVGPLHGTETYGRCTSRRAAETLAVQHAAQHKLEVCVCDLKTGSLLVYYPEWKTWVAED